MSSALSIFKQLAQLPVRCRFNGLGQTNVAAQAKCWYLHGMPRKSRPQPASAIRCINSSAEVIRLVVMMYVLFPLSLSKLEDLLIKRGIDRCHETVRFWWNRFGPMFAGDIRRQRVSRMKDVTNWP